MAVTHRDGAECPECGIPVSARPIAGSVGTGGNNLAADVRAIQQMLNALSPIEGGPVQPLAVDGIIGPKTVGAISKYQTKVLGWADGRIDPSGPTIGKLVPYILNSPTIPNGPLGQTRAPLAASPSGGSAAPAADGLLLVEVAKICMRVMEPRINTLRWKFTRVTPSLHALVAKHFATKFETVTSADIAHVQTILDRIHFWIARFNAFGILPLDNVVIFDPVVTQTVIARTTRGGDKMSTKQFEIYSSGGKLVKSPGQTIWVTSIFGDQQREEKHWTMLHEFAHFVGARDRSGIEINDNAYADEAKFVTLSKFQRLHNAESLSLFYLECLFGTRTVMDLPRMSTHRAKYDVFPKVNADGSIVTA